MHCGALLGKENGRSVCNVTFATQLLGFKPGTNRLRGPLNIAKRNLAVAMFY